MTFCHCPDAFPPFTAPSISGKRSGLMVAGSMPLAIARKNKSFLSALVLARNSFASGRHASSHAAGFRNRLRFTAIHSFGMLKTVLEASRQTHPDRGQTATGICPHRAP